MMKKSIRTVGDHLHEWRATMEAWKMTDSRPTGPRGEASADSGWPTKTRVKNRKTLQKSTPTGDNVFLINTTPWRGC